MITEYATLSKQDLDRYRSHRAHMLAIELASGNYNRDEIERAFREGFILWAEFIERYGLPPEEDDLVIDPNSGRCYVKS